MSATGPERRKQSKRSKRTPEEQAREALERRERIEQAEKEADDRDEDPDYLPNLCKRISEHVKKVPDEIVSSNSDCLHYARTCDLVMKVYSICGACIRNKVWKQDWEQAKKAMGARGSFPSADSIAQSRKFLIGAVMNNGDKIAHNYRISGRDNRLVDNVMSQIFTLDMLQFLMLPKDDQDRHRRFVAENDDWLVMNNVVVASSAAVSNYRSPVLKYRMSQFVDAMYQLATAWNKLPYSQRLIYYIELLRIRMGQFINFSHSDKVFDVHALRHCVKEPSRECPDGEYQATARMIQDVSPVMMEIFKRTVRFAAYRPATDALMSSLKGKRNTKFLIKKFGEWITEKIKVMIPEGASEKMGQYLLTMSLRPGERSVYARQFPSGTNLMDEQFILGKYRKMEFNYLSELKQKNFAVIIEKELPKLLRKRPKDCGQESPQLLLCLYELIEMYTKAAYFGRMDLTDFIVFEVDYEKRQSDFIYVEEPIMVQVFNHFQLYYRGDLYRFDSFILSFLGWLKIMERDYKRNLRGCDISEWYMEILGTKDPSLRMWEPASLFGSDDEEESSFTTSDDDSESSSSEDEKESGPGNTADAGSTSSSASKQQPKSSGQDKPKCPDAADPFAIKSVL